MTISTIKHPHVSLADFQAICQSADAVVEEARSIMFAPDKIKQPPVFNTAELSVMSGVDRNKIQYAWQKGVIEPPQKNGSRTEWSLSAATHIVRHFNPSRYRDPKTSKAFVLAVANFKGGVAKTTTTATLAQGLSLRGHKVLVIDLDAQASLTSLFALNSGAEISDDETFLSVTENQGTSITPAIRKTYWDGIDIVSANLTLYNAEFFLPVRTSVDPTYSFWNLLNLSLEDARDKYDIILIDTSPSLGYVTINAFYAADGLLMPMSPSALDFSSSAQFWRMVTETMEGINVQRGDQKVFSFVDILLSRVDKADNISIAIRQWINAAYSIYVLPLEIPKTSTAATASAEFGTVYDLKPGTVQAKTLKRAKDAYDSLVQHIELQIQGAWSQSKSSGAQ